MKARVIVAFRDIENFTKVNNIGEVIEVSKDRFEKLKGLKLVKEVDSVLEEKETLKEAETIGEVKRSVGRPKKEA